MALMHTHKKGKVVVSSTLNGTQVVTEKRNIVLGTRRQIEIHAMNPSIRNLGDVGVALVNAIRESA